MTDPLLLVIALNGLAALGAAGAFWMRAASRDAALERIETRVSELAIAVSATRPSRDGEIVEAVGAMRDDLTFVSSHLSSMTSGQLDIKNVVDRAVKRHLADLMSELDDAEGRAELRLHALRDRLEAAIATAARDLADGRAAAEAAAEAETPAALARIEARLETLTETLARPAPERGPRRAPPAFDGGRVVTLVAGAEGGRS